MAMTAGSAADNQGANNLFQQQQRAMFTYRVELDGTVELPEVGAVMLAGLTLDEAERKIAHPFLPGEVPQCSLTQQTHAVVHRRSVLERDEGRTARSVLRWAKRGCTGSAHLISPQGCGDHVAWREPLVVGGVQ